MGIRSRDAICNIDYQNLSGGYSPARIQPGKGAKSAFLTAPALIGTTISPGPTSWRPIPGLGHVLLATAWGGGLSNRSVLPRVRHDLGLFRPCRTCELHLPEHILGEKPTKRTRRVPDVLMGGTWACHLKAQLKSSLHWEEKTSAVPFVVARSEKWPSHSFLENAMAFQV